MHLCPDGKWAIGEDAWGKIVRVNMLEITDADWPEVPGVKKAWRMQGFEGEEGMAFHPIISEVKDVDGDGKPDIFRLRSEHAGAQIERLRYGDGSVVWVSEPVGALYGDESRLAVFDLHGNGELSVVYADKGGLYCLDAHSGETRWKVPAAGATSPSAGSSTTLSRASLSIATGLFEASTGTATRRGPTTTACAAAIPMLTKSCGATPTATAATRSL